MSITAFLLGTFGLLCVSAAPSHPLRLRVHGRGAQPHPPRSGRSNSRALLCAAFLIAQLATSSRFFGEGFGAYLSGLLHGGGGAPRPRRRAARSSALSVYPLRSILSTAGAYVLFSAPCGACALRVPLGHALKGPPSSAERSGNAPQNSPRGKSAKRRRGKTRPAPMPDPEPMMGYSRSAYGMPADGRLRRRGRRLLPTLTPGRGIMRPRASLAVRTGIRAGAPNGYRESDRNSDMNGYPNGYGGNGQYGYPASFTARSCARAVRAARSMTDGSTHSRSTRSSNMRQTQYPNYGYGQDGFLGYYGQPRPQPPRAGVLCPAGPANRRATAGTATSATTVPIARRSPKRRAPIRGETSSFRSTPAQDYTKNLIYNQDSYFNSRVRRSSVEPDDSPARKARLYHPRDL